MNELKFEPEEIVTYRGELGTLIRDRIGERRKMHFLPAKQRGYLIETLPVVLPEDVNGTTLEEKIEYLKLKIAWSGVKSEVKNTHVINNGEYIIFEVLHIPSLHKTDTLRTLYHICLNFKELSRMYESLDSAMIGLLDYKYQGNNSWAGEMFERMLQMERK